MSCPRGHFATEADVLYVSKNFAHSVFGRPDDSLQVLGHEFEIFAIFQTLRDSGDFFSHSRVVLNNNYNFRMKWVHTVGVCTRIFRHSPPEQLI